jgi:hypothetical protein
MGIKSLFKPYKVLKRKVVGRGSEVLDRKIELQLAPGVEINDRFYSSISKRAVKEEWDLGIVYIKPHGEEAAPINLAELQNYAEEYVQKENIPFGMKEVWGVAAGFAIAANPFFALGALPLFMGASRMHGKQIYLRQRVISLVDDVLNAPTNVAVNSLPAYIAPSAFRLPKAQELETMFEDIPDVLPVKSERADYISKGATTGMPTSPSIGVSMMSSGLGAAAAEA